MTIHAKGLEGIILYGRLKSSDTFILPSVPG